MKDSLSKIEVLVFTLLLTLVAVGLRNYETGLALDGVLYAAIARNIIESGEWFSLFGNVNDFRPFAEHPHLGLWTLAAFFKVFGAQDWVARLPNHLFLWGFFFVFFLRIRKGAGEWAAIFATGLLWSFSFFTRWFNTPCLDAGCLFFAFLSILAFEKSRGFWSGMFLALAFMFKGLTIVGFVPCFLFLVWKNWRPWQVIASFILGFGLLLSLYFFSVKISAVPNFFDIYWSRQITHRFGLGVSLGNLVSGDFWLRLLKDSHYSLLLVPVIFWTHRRALNSLGIPAVLLVSFCFIYASKARFGDHIWLTVLPWIAWIVGVGMASFLRNGVLAERSSSKILPYLNSILIVGFIGAHYLPVMKPRYEMWESLKLTQNLRDQGFNKLLFDSKTLVVDFLVLCPWAWYANMESDYCYRKNCEIPSSVSNMVFVMHEPEPSREEELKAKNWCLYADFELEDNMKVFLSCDVLSKSYRQAKLLK